jgi:hypothetical protein
MNISGDIALLFKCIRTTTLVRPIDRELHSASAASARSDLPSAERNAGRQRNSRVAAIEAPDYIRAGRMFGAEPISCLVQSRNINCKAELYFLTVVLICEMPLDYERRRTGFASLSSGEIAANSARSRRRRSRASIRDEG